MKFAVKDRFVLGTLPGTVTGAAPGTAFRDGIYSVTFDGHEVVNAEGSYKPTNNFRADFFEEHAELLVPEPVSNQDTLRSLSLGDEFTLSDNRNQVIWSSVRFIEALDYRSNGDTMVRGFLNGREFSEEICVWRTDMIELIETLKED